MTDLTESPPRAAAATPSLTPTRAVLLLIAAGVALRLVLAGVIGLGIDESYMVVAGRGLALSYFDHPPMAWWLSWAAAHLAGSEAAWVVRLPFIALFGGTTWLMYRLGAALFEPWAGVVAALLMTLAPVFTLSTGSWVLPDGPLMFFQVAAALCLVRAVFGGTEREVWLGWLGAGLFCGLALLSKYHALFLLAGAGLFVLTAQPRRLLHPAPYAAVALAFLVFLPVIVWNAQQDWVSFLFQGGRGAPGQGLRPERLAAYLGGQAAYLNPLLWPVLVWALLRALAGGPGDARRWLLGCLAIGPVALFTAVSLWSSGRMLPHWVAPGYLFVFPLAGAAVARPLLRGDRRVRVWLTAAAALLGLAMALLASHTATGWLTRLIPGLEGQKDVTVEAMEWRDLVPALAGRGLLDRPNLFVATRRWQDAGKVGHALGGRLPVLVLSRDPRQFAFGHDPAALRGWDAVVVVPAGTVPEALEAYRPHFATLEPLGPVVVMRGGRPALTLDLVLARDFHTPYGLPFPRSR